MDDKRHFLERFIKERPQAKLLVFTRTRVRAERVTRAMDRAGITGLTLHGELEQDAREQALTDFREGKQRLLIATDVSARGIDVPDVTHVINYDLPEQADYYVHRVGRTGRGTKRGVAYSFCAPAELPLLQKIEEYTGTKIAVVDMDRADYRATVNFAERETMGLAQLMKEVENLRTKRKSENNFCGGWN